MSGRFTRGVGTLLGSALLAAGAVVLSSCGTGLARAGDASGAAPNDWPSWGRTGDEEHYSPLDQIGTATVGKLGLAWHYDLPSENTLTEPVEAAGKLFVTTGHSYVRALDAVTGKLLWEYDSHTREQAGLNLRFGWGPKGLSYWNGKVFIATQDGRLIALDAHTGKPAWEQRDFPAGELRYINGPPRVFGGKLIIGHGGADISPIRGFVTAYDANTGKRLWRFYTTPGAPAETDDSRAMQVAVPTWKGTDLKPGQGGGGTAWNGFSYDPALGLIYIGVGNGFPYNQALRSPGGGDNLFLASVVAVKADTGAYAWHYQVCPGEQWDCTAVQDMTLADITVDGRPRKVLMQAPKNGFFYVIDRTDGKLISAKPFAKVTWASGIDLRTGRPVENPGIRYHGKGMFELWPGVRGAHSWLPQSFSPKTGLVYLPVIEGAAMIGDQGVNLKDPRAGMGVNVNPDLDVPGAHRSFLKAWDPVSQTARWTAELPGNWPGGTMATGGNLVFEGRIDGKLIAYDASTGKVVWSYQAQSPIVAPPITYSVRGKQYVTVLTGSGASGGGLFSAGNANFRTDYRAPRHVLTFALDGKDVLPPAPPAPPMAPPADPDYKPNAALEAQGKIAFAANGCFVCHGANAVGGGSAPDLRTSPYPANKDAFHAALTDGSLVTAGMPQFKEISNDQIEAIRQYLRARGQQIGHEPAEKEAADSGLSRTSH